MEFSAFAYCAENKKLNFTPFMSSGTLIHQTSNMGMCHSKEMPFVELTGHKITEPIVSSSFEIKDFTRSFNIAQKIHSFAANAVRSDNVLTRKDMYGHQFSFSFSQLVGGFVGSKSQIGSSSKESCQMWDIIFNKLAEFCDTHHHPQNCSNFGRVFSQDILKSICKKERPSLVIENSANITSDKTLSPKLDSSQDTSNKTLSPKSSSSRPDCSSYLSSNISKQSYAEVARNFASVQQNKQGISTPSSAMPRRRNSSNCRNFVKCEFSRTLASNWRNHCSPHIKDYRNHTRFFSGSQRRPDNRNFKSNKYFGKEQKTDQKRKQTCSSESQRVDNKKNFTRVTPNSVQIAPKISTYQAASETSSAPSNKMNQVGQTSPIRVRFMSECSTDSDDSFVVFDSEADCDSVIVAVIAPSTSDSDLSEDVFSYQFSDDGDENDNTDCIDGDVTQNVTGLSELNERWKKENSEYPTSEKNPVKVHFADTGSLETVHPMIAWNYAYRAARCGPWEQVARDRDRFKTKIKKMEPVLARILSPKHRYCIWKERFASMPART